MLLSSLSSSATFVVMSNDTVKHDEEDTVHLVYELDRVRVWMTSGAIEHSKLLLCSDSHPLCRVQLLLC